MPSSNGRSRMTVSRWPSIEVDEARGIHEVSLYVEADDLAARRGCDAPRRGLCPMPALVVESETLPDIDWVARSLEGLEAGPRRPVLRARRA